jgi:hypothetical protein
MNEKRRSKIKEALKILEVLKSDLNEIKDEEQKALNSIPENLRWAVKAEEMDYNIDNFDYCIDDISSIIDRLENMCFVLTKKQKYLLTDLRNSI